ncbi:Trefoil factor 3, partial [Nowakowskiella sp. JEL0078]
MSSEESETSISSKKDIVFEEESTPFVSSDIVESDSDSGSYAPPRPGSNTEINRLKEQKKVAKFLPSIQKSPAKKSSSENIETKKKNKALFREKITDYTGDDENEGDSKKSSEEASEDKEKYKRKYPTEKRNSKILENLEENLNDNSDDVEEELKKKSVIEITNDDDSIAHGDDDEVPAEFVVEKVVDTKMQKGKRHYLLKWVGYPHDDNTWEPEENVFCTELVADFWELRNSQKHGSTNSAAKKKRTSETLEDRDSKKKKHGSEPTSSKSPSKSSSILESKKNNPATSTKLNGTKKNSKVSDELRKEFDEIAKENLGGSNDE